MTEQKSTLGEEFTVMPTTMGLCRGPDKYVSVLIPGVIATVGLEGDIPSR